MSITPREKQVLDILMRGYSRKQIAIQLNVGVRTVDDHIENVYKKYGVSGKFHLIAKLTAEGMPCPCCGRAAQ